METLKTIINSSWFRAALAGGAGAALLVTGNVLYAGIAIGVGVRELLLAFKSWWNKRYIMARGINLQSYNKKSKKRRPGVHSKSKNSRSKSSKLYVKKYRGQLIVTGKR